jgi:hypothetical protein
VIREHLELKRRNAALDHEMPLANYVRRGPGGPGDEGDTSDEDTRPNVIES